MPQGSEFRPARSLGSTWAAIASMSGVINVLSLAGTVYMLQVFDRVLTHRRALIDAVDHVAVLGGGRLQSFVTREDFLSRHQRSRARTQPEPIPVLAPDRRAGSPS